MCWGGGGGGGEDFYIFGMDPLEGKYGQAHNILVLIASSSNKGSSKYVHVHRLARAFAAHIHKVWMQMKTQSDQRLDLASLDMLAWALLEAFML